MADASRSACADARAAGADPREDWEAMTPYYQQDGIVIYCGEALAVLSSVKLSGMTALVADPPYSSGGMFRSDRAGDPSDKYSVGKSWPNKHGESSRPVRAYGSFSGNSRDQRSYLTWCAMWLSAAWSMADPGAQAFVCTDWRQLPTTTDALQAGGWTWRGICVWDKGIGRPMKGRFRNHLEYIVWASHGQMPPADDIYPSTLLKHALPQLSEREHVTQKPITLMRELLSVSAQGLVLDPFMGSGTTLVAAKALNRKAVGIDVDERNCEIAARRLSQGALNLFGEATA